MDLQFRSKGVVVVPTPATHWVHFSWKVQCLCVSMDSLKAVEKHFSVPWHHKWELVPVLGEGRVQAAKHLTKSSEETALNMLLVTMQCGLWIEKRSLWSLLRPSAGKEPALLPVYPKVCPISLKSANLSSEAAIICNKTQIKTSSVRCSKAYSEQ